MNQKEKESKEFLKSQKLKITEGLDRVYAGQTKEKDPRIKEAPVNTPIQNMMHSTRDQIEVKKVDGRTQITYHKALIKGKVSGSQLMDSVLVAARMQAEMYINKMARGAILEAYEVKALKDLSDIAKINIVSTENTYIDVPTTSDVQNVKASIWEVLKQKNPQLDG